MLRAMLTQSFYSHSQLPGRILLADMLHALGQNGLDVGIRKLIKYGFSSLRKDTRRICFKTLS